MYSMKHEQIIEKKPEQKLVPWYKWVHCIKISLIYDPYPKSPQYYCRFFPIDLYQMYSNRDLWKNKRRKYDYYAYDLCFGCFIMTGFGQLS